jgi:hypothetical protein
MEQKLLNNNTQKTIEQKQTHNTNNTNLQNKWKNKTS